MIQRIITSAAGDDVQVRATLTPAEMREAARISRPSRFWLRFIASNGYAISLCVVALVVGCDVLLNHRKNVGGRPMVYMFIFGAISIWISWFRRSAKVAKAASAMNAKASSISLESDGIRSTFANGGSRFIPWASFHAWREGKNIFLLTGDDTVVLPAEDGNRNSIRALIQASVGS